MRLLCHSNLFISRPWRWSESRYCYSQEAREGVHADTLPVLHYMSSQMRYGAYLGTRHLNLFLVSVRDSSHVSWYSPSSFCFRHCLRICDLSRPARTNATLIYPMLYSQIRFRHHQNAHQEARNYAHANQHANSKSGDEVASINNLSVEEATSMRRGR